MTFSQERWGKQRNRKECDVISNRLTCNTILIRAFPTNNFYFIPSFAHIYTYARTRTHPVSHSEPNFFFSFAVQSIKPSHQNV